jgi:hypothetical protein
MTNGTNPTSEGSRAARLRLARRVDWRFLLGEPSLGDVALAGPPDPGLRAALEACARSIAADAADVAVLTRGVTDADLRTAIARVRTGGQVVAESSGLLGWRPGGRVGPAEARQVVRALRRAGFGSITIYVVWPAHGRGTAMIPARERAPMAAWLTRKLDRRLWRLAAVAGAVGARSGLLAMLAPSVVIVARRPADPSAPAAWLAERLGTPSFVAVTPRFGASGHVVALGDLAVAPGEGPTTVLKVARLDDDGEGVRLEAASLASIEPTLGVAGLAPRPLEAQWDARPPYLVESGVPGRPLDPATVRRDPRGASTALADLVAALPTSGDSHRPLGALMGPALDTVRRHAAGSGLAALLAATDRVMEVAADRSVPLVFEHGDLAHPNLVRSPSGALGAVDWERARPDGLPLHDLSIGLAYVAAAARRATAAADQAAAFQTALTGPAPWARELVDAELARLGVDPDLRTPLLIAPWVRSAAWLAERVEPSTWLADRSVAHWRAMLDLPPDHA